MTIQEAYLRSLQKNEQNLANGGIKLDPGRFVLLFNEAQDRLIRYYLNRKDDETIRSIQTLLVYWKSLNKINHIDDPESTSFGLPDDYLWFSNIKERFLIMDVRLEILSYGRLRTRMSMSFLGMIIINLLLTIGKRSTP